jgi:hypothetical protein
MAPAQGSGGLAGPASARLRSALEASFQARALTESPQRKLRKTSGPNILCWLGGLGLRALPVDMDGFPL